MHHASHRTVQRAQCSSTVRSCGRGVVTWVVGWFGAGLGEGVGCTLLRTGRRGHPKPRVQAARAVAVLLRRRASGVVVGRPAAVPVVPATTAVVVRVVALACCIVGVGVHCARACVCVCACVFVVNAQQKTTHKIVGARVYCKHARTLPSASKVKYTHVHTHTHTRMRLEDPCLPRSHDARCAPPCEAVARTHSIILLFVLSSLSRPFVPLH